MRLRKGNLLGEIEYLIERLGMRTLDECSFRTVLGVGGQGFVVEYERGDGKRVAAKIVIAPNDAIAIRRLHREVEAMKRCSNFGTSVIAALSDVRQVAALPVHYFFMEIGRGQSLSQQITNRPLPWQVGDAVKIAWRILWALSPAHALGYAHRDLHPGNILVNDEAYSYERHSGEGDPGMTILDFGVQRHWFDGLALDSFESGGTFRPVGSVTYASPEALMAPEKVDARSDVWSVGVLLFQMIYGNLPFYESTLYKLMISTKNGCSLFSDIDGLSSDETRFLQLSLGKFLSPSLSEGTGRFHPGGARQVLADYIFFNAANTFKGEDLDYYLSVGGDIWQCKSCRSIVHPFGSRCPVCGRHEEEWLHWSFALQQFGTLQSPIISR